MSRGVVAGEAGNALARGGVHGTDYALVLKAGARVQVCVLVLYSLCTFTQLLLYFPNTV